MKTTTEQKVVTRFAPSPTGFLSLGNYRTALFNFLYAKQHNGKFILRIEDTDKERNKKEYERDIIESFEWLSLPFNEFYRQSERTDIYKTYLQKLVDEDKAYISKEEKEGGRSEVIRFRNQGSTVVFNDIIRGEISFDTKELGDFVIAKSMEEPVFHFSVVVDDFEMGITHIIRGEDHISNTPRHILIQEAIGAPRPQYAHLPLILASDRSKLSKRNGAISIKESRERGYTPEAIINYLALLGWNPGTEQEIFSIESLIQQFSLEKIQKGGAVFNEEKLNWTNKEYIRALPKEKLMNAIEERMSKTGKFTGISRESLILLTPLITERIEKFEDITDMAEKGELDWFFEEPQYIFPESLVWKKGSSRDEAKKHLQALSEILSTLSLEEFTVEKIESIILPYADKEGKGNVLWPMRFALSGKEKSPDPFTLACVLGKEKTLTRLKKAANRL
ncbi:MAG: glutamate--tRNA ligase [Candidatus Pacebacteria bacterium]|nr:glutamate--tRNA ligase [Candidatus Paceibacterota bacterium]